MRIQHPIHIDALVALLLGETTLPGVEPWRSRIRALSKALTFLENDQLLAHQLLAHPKLSALPGHDTRVVGITGLPGSGKSTLTSLLTKKFRARGQHVAVLAVDPSSPLSGGAILGDRVRMHEHFGDDKVYIRSLSARGALGGVSRAMRSAIHLVCLLGFDTVLVETVGIGQSESDIVDLADTTVLVLMPESGDEIQLMKAGVLQLAHVYVVNKMDLGKTERLCQELTELVALEHDGWLPPVLPLSAARDQGVDALVTQLLAHAQHEKQQPLGQHARQQRAHKEVLQCAWSLLEKRVSQAVTANGTQSLDRVVAGQTTAMYLAKEILQKMNIDC